MYNRSQYFIQKIQRVRRSMSKQVLKITISFFSPRTIFIVWPHVKFLRSLELRTEFKQFLSGLDSSTITGLSNIHFKRVWDFFSIMSINDTPLFNFPVYENYFHIIFTSKHHPNF